MTVHVPSYIILCKDSRAKDVIGYYEEEYKSHFRDINFLQPRWVASPTLMERLAERTFRIFRTFRTFRIFAMVGVSTSKSM